MVGELRIEAGLGLRAGHLGGSGRGSGIVAKEFWQVGFIDRVDGTVRAV